MDNTEKDVTVSVRINSLIYAAAQDRAELAGIKLPDIIRAGYESVASGDAAAFNCGLYRVVAGNDKQAQTAWLSRRARELFYEREGVLYGKSDRGSRKAGEPVGVLLRAGLPSASIDAKYVPVRDVVFALHHDSWRGEVVNIDQKVTNNAIHNLCLMTDYTVEIKAFEINVPQQVLKAVISGRQRAVIYPLAKNNAALVSIITALVVGEASIPVLLTDGNKQTVRQAIHAAALGDSDYLVSLS